MNCGSFYLEKNMAMESFIIEAAPILQLHMCIMEIVTIQRKSHTVQILFRTIGDFS